MAPTRVPLMGLNSQAQNQRTMSRRPLTYGKKRYGVTPRAPLWDSQLEEESTEKENTVDESNKSEHLSPKSGTDDQLASLLDGLEIAPGNTITNRGPEEAKSTFKPNVEEVSPEQKPLLKPSLAKVALQESPRAAEVGRSEVDPQHESSLTAPVLRHENLHHAAEVPPAKRATRRVAANVHASYNQPDRSLDVSLLLAESHAHTKRPSTVPTKFADFAAKIDTQFEIRKLADGSFGDVYRLNARGTAKSGARSKLERLGGSVLKVIPVSGNSGPGSRKFSRINDVVNEVRVLRTLDPLHGFTRFRDIHVVQGTYPKSFTDAFYVFQGESMATLPEKHKASQHFAIIEMDDAGIDIDTLRQLNVFQCHDIFWPTVIILAHGETTVEFETRDMHQGNICIRPFHHNGTMNLQANLPSRFMENQATHLGHLGLTETRVTLIDYTMSRARTEDNNIAFFDMARHASFFLPPEKFDVNGIINLQQQAYWQMRDAVRAASQSKGAKTKEDWSLFVPLTNVVWLAYLLSELFTIMSTTYVQGSNEACAQAQEALGRTLKNVLAVLKTAAAGGEGGVGSAGEVLTLALESGWLSKEEVEAFQERLQSEA